MGRKKRSRSIVREFDAYFGTGTLEDWQRLCRDVGLTKSYPSITQCRKVRFHSCCIFLSIEQVDDWIVC